MQGCELTTNACLRRMMFHSRNMIRSNSLQRFDPFVVVASHVSFPLLLTPITLPTFHSPTSSSPFLSKLKPNSLFTSSSSSSFFSSTNPPRSAMLHHDPFVSDVYATAISGAVALSCLRLWQETAKRDLFDQVVLNV